MPPALKLTGAAVAWRWAVAAVLLLGLALVAAGRANASSHCSSQASAALIRDCRTLIDLKSELDPNGTLNWAEGTPLASWQKISSNATAGVRWIDFRTRTDPRLAGTVPAGLGSLPNLERLWLPNNDLTGSIPAELGNLSNLITLHVGGNKLTGSIPAELGNLANLTHLLLEHNQLDGSIPAELANLSSLQSLNLGRNELSGSIPPELGSIASLTDLALRENQLTGSIPPELGNLSNLTKLYLQDNQLTGSIPTELTNLSNLADILLSENQLTGSIPPGFGSLSKLFQLSLWDNQLTGSIPPELGTMSNMQYLFLDTNQLTGSIPPELGSLSKLVWFQANANQLDGSIPVELGNLSKLKYLYLDQNQLTGGIPTELGDLTRLVQLSLHRNPDLGGSIPTWLGSLTNLTTLLLDKTGLTGEVPAELGQLSKVRVLGLSCNDLSGSLPDALGSAGSGVTGNDRQGNPLKTVLHLQGNRRLQLATSQLPASLATPRTSPELEVVRSGPCRGDTELDRDFFPVREEESEPEPKRESKPKSKPKPKPPPPPQPKVIGATAAAQAILPPDDGAPLRLERRDLPGTVLELDIGSVSADRQDVVLGGIIRDETNGQTYIIVRREPLDSDGGVVRRWVPPDSPLVSQIPWPDVLERYTVPTAVLAAIPLDGLPTVPRQAIRFVGNDDDRVFRWDSETHQWRHVPNPATFQALGLYWCDVVVADPDFLERLPDALIGPPYPASSTPARDDYPNCRPA
ncbi:MAG: hypothetical protein OXG79_05395 [Chloroflexi bacterium]|nr:hypothetical protein [Chloroflexota bacterium]